MQANLQCRPTPTMFLAGGLGLNLIPAGSHFDADGEYRFNGLFVGRTYLWIGTGDEIAEHNSEELVSGEPFTAENSELFIRGTLDELVLSTVQEVIG